MPQFGAVALLLGHKDPVRLGGTLKAAMLIPLQLGKISLVPYFLLFGMTILGMFTITEAYSLYLSGGSPVDLTLEDIEAGRLPANPYVRLGRRVTLYRAMVYEPEEYYKRGRTVDETYYPIVSVARAQAAGLGPGSEELAQSPDDPERTETLPEEISILVRTRRYEDVRALPKGCPLEEEPLEGMLEPAPALIPGEVLGTYRGVFRLDPATAGGGLHVLREGQSPWPLSWLIGASVANLLGFLLALAWIRSDVREFNASGDARPKSVVDEERRREAASVQGSDGLEAKSEALDAGAEEKSGT